MNKYIESISCAYRALELLYNSKPLDLAEICNVYSILHMALRSRIYGELMKLHNDEKEKEIRELIYKYVIGYTDKKSGIKWYGALKPIEALMDKVYKKGDDKLLKEYYDLYDDFFALASFRSFKHYCLYMEKDLPKNELVWTYTQDIFSGWYYYANRMVFNKDVKFIEKQLPTGYGKSYSDVMLISYILGHNKDERITKVVGNKNIIVDCIKGVADKMKTKKYAKIFPYYEQFNGKTELMFETLKKGGSSSGGGELKVTGSKYRNLCVYSKDMDIDGVRCHYLFLDDITQRSDRNKISRHNADIDSYEGTWFKRNDDLNNFFIVAGGTAYSIYDILSYLKRKFGINDAIQSKFNKYTKISVSNEICKDGISVFISVPKLDYETDESTYPEKVSTEKARKQRLETDYEMFMAMEQQTPIAPADNPFYFENLKSYETLPEIGENGRNDYCWATLDGKRKGSDFCAMPICTKIGEFHYLIDCIYDNRPMEECYDKIVRKIINHNITLFYIESNINEGLSTLLKKMLKERGYNACKIVEVYNTVKKDERIANEEASIKNNIIFPKMGMYGNSSEMGKALTELYTYTYSKKVEHDDFTDALSLYSRYHIRKKTQSCASVMVFKR